jgi:hypothetical protein
MLQAMCASLMTYQASHHPAALHSRPRLLQVRLVEMRAALCRRPAARSTQLPGVCQWLHTYVLNVAVLEKAACKAGEEGKVPHPASLITYVCCALHVQEVCAAHLLYMLWAGRQHAISLLTS